MFQPDPGEAMKLSKHFNLLMASAVSLSLAASPIGVMPSYAQNAPAAEAPGDAGWQKEFQFWRSASKSGKAADYEGYLKSYPAGKFASVAKQRLDSLNGVDASAADASKAADVVKDADVVEDNVTVDQVADAAPVKAGDADKTRDLEMWRQVSKTGTQADYEKYLKAFPKGKFAKIAKSRVEGLIAQASTAKTPVVEETAQAEDSADGEVQSNPVEAGQAAEAGQQADQPDDQEAAADDAGQTQDAEQAQDTDQPENAQQAQDTAQSDDAARQDQAAAPASSDWEQEYALWKAASDGNTVSEYEAYLSTYPKGKFAAIAQARIVQLAAAEKPADNIAEGDEQPADQQANAADAPQDANQPDDQADQADQANQMDPSQDPDQAQPDDQSQMAANQNDPQSQDDLGQTPQVDQTIQFTEGTPETEDEFLNRETRHEIQGRLTSLGYDTFGSDGSFGPNSRTAISNWQNDNGAPANGYLSGDQIAQIRKLSQVSYASWLNSQPEVVEQPVVRPRREKVVVIEERRNPAVDAAIAVGVLGAVVGAHKFGKMKIGRARPGRVKVIGKFKFGKMNNVRCKKRRRC